MKIHAKKLLLLTIPLLLFGAVWGIYWWRLHPPETAFDKKARALLLSADRVDVEIETIEFPVGRVRTPVLRLTPEELAPVVKHLNLTQEQSHDWGTGYVPEMCFIFYKSGRNQAEITISYSPLGFNYFFSNKPQFTAWVSRGLHPTTIRRFRELVARHPEMIEALTKAGVKSQDLAPSRINPNKPLDVS